MIRFFPARLRRALGIATVGASLLVLGNMPVGACNTLASRTANTLPVPTEEEQHSSELSAREGRQQVVARAQRASTHADPNSRPTTIAWSRRSSVRPAAGNLPPPTVFVGSPKPLRC